MVRGGFGGANLQQLMQQAKKMQAEMEKQKKELEESVVEAKAGGEMVVVQMNGKREILSLKINPQAVDPEDVEMLEDLIIAAINDANSQIDALSEKLSPQIPGNLGGMF